MDYDITGHRTYLPNEVEMTNNKFDLTENDIPTRFIDLSLDVLHEIFDYLTLGDIYYSIYHIHQNWNEFIDKTYTCLSMTTMSYHHFLYYCQSILPNNKTHCENISSIKLSNEQPFNQIDEFFPLITFYNNLKILYLYSPTDSHLKYLPTLLPNLEELNIISKKDRFLNMHWFSSMKKLKKCSINPQSHGIELNYSMKSLSTFLSSLTITLLSSYDFYVLFTLLPTRTLRYLNISLLDSEFSYMKTCQSPTTSAVELTDLIVNLTLVSIKNASSFYDVIRFLTSSLRSVENFTYLCRFADEIRLEEETFRSYLSFAYSVKHLKLFIEMNHLSNFNEQEYAYPFWIKKNIHVNIYQNQNHVIKRVRIHTLPLPMKIVNLPNHAEEFYQLIPNQSSKFSNIHQFKLNDTSEINYHFSDDLTLTPKRIYSSSNLSFLFHLTHLSSFIITNDDLYTFINQCSQWKSFPNIHSLQLNSCSNILLKESEEIRRIFPCLRSISIHQVDEFQMFGDILDRFIQILSNKQSINYLHISGLIVDEIYPENSSEEQIKTIFNELFSCLKMKKDTYRIAFNRTNQSVHFWF